jgi:hypothetical protein
MQVFQCKNCVRYKLLQEQMKKLDPSSPSHLGQGYSQYVFINSFYIINTSLFRFRWNVLKVKIKRTENEALLLSSTGSCATARCFTLLTPM